MKAIVTAIAIIAGSITTANANNPEIIEAKVNHHLAEASHHQTEADYHKTEFSRHQVEFKRHSAKVRRIANEVEPRPLTSGSECYFATEGKRHRYENHLAKMDRHLVQAIHLSDKRDRHETETIHHFSEAR